MLNKLVEKGKELKEAIELSTAEPHRQAELFIKKLIKNSEGFELLEDYTKPRSEAEKREPDFIVSIRGVGKIGIEVKHRKIFKDKPFKKFTIIDDKLKLWEKEKRKVVYLVVLSIYENEEEANKKDFFNTTNLFYLAPLETIKRGTFNLDFLHRDFININPNCTFIHYLRVIK